MPVNSDWEVALALFNVTGGFITYFFLSSSDKLHKWVARRYSENGSLVQKILIQRLLGVSFLGIIPFFLSMMFTSKGLAGYGVSCMNFDLTLYWTVGLSCLVVFTSYLNVRKPSNLAMYPQIRVQEWSASLLFQSGITWALYLLAYEFLFRGILFFTFLDLYGLVPAIAINVSIYALAHIPKGIKEAVGAIPFGIIICLLTYKTGTIWVAFFVHVVMALGNEWLSIYANPAMTFKKRG